MSMTITRNATALLLTLTLGACGGGGGSGGGGGGDGGGGDNGGGTIVPQASSGFAKPGDAIRNDVTYSPQNVNILLADRNTFELSLREDDDVTVQFRINPNSGEQEAVLTVANRLYFLDGDNGNYFTSTSPGSLISINRVKGAENNAAELYVLFNSIRGSLPNPEGAYFVIGYDTDPAAVDARMPEIGGVGYTGTIYANAVDENSDLYGAPPALDNTESGVITLNADFATNSVSGEFTLGEFAFNGRPAATAAATYTIPTAQINGNGFSGTFTVEDGALLDGQTLAGAEINGSFYGSDADAIGGHIFTEIQETGEETIYVQGAFLADEN